MKEVHKGLRLKIASPKGNHYCTAIGFGEWFGSVSRARDGLQRGISVRGSASLPSIHMFARMTSVCVYVYI